MFVRVKSTPNSAKKYVQIVVGYREGGKVKQRIVRHVGYANDEDELVRLKDLAEYLKECWHQENEFDLSLPPLPFKAEIKEMVSLSSAELIFYRPFHRKFEFVKIYFDSDFDKWEITNYLEKYEDEFPVNTEYLGEL